MLECQGMITKGNSEDSYATALADSGHHFSLTDYCYKCWLIVVLMLLECISLEVKKTFKKKKKHQKGGKIIINPSFRFFCNNPAEGVQIMAPDDFCSQLLSHFTKKASICIRSPICQSVYNAITCFLMYSFPLWESIKWYKQQGSKRGVRTVIAHSSLVSLCSVWMLG